MPDNEHPLTTTPAEAWYGSPVEPGFNRLDLGQQLAVARAPDRYVTGDALYGWSVTSTRPEFNELTWGSQNLLRARLNDLENPRGLLGDNQQYINEVQDLIDKGRGEFNAWKNSDNAIKNLIPYAPDLGDLAPVLEAVDPNWNGLVEWRAWEKENPEVATYLTTARGIVPEDTFSHTRNRDAFMLVINMEMTKAQIQQEVDEYEKAAGTYERWTQFIGGGAVRQLVLDSDAAKTLGLGAAGKAIGITAGAIKGAEFVSQLPKLSKALTIAEKAGSAGTAVHTLLSKNLRLGTAAAMAIEGAATGALWDAQHQLGMQEMTDYIGEQPLEYDYTDSLKAAGYGALFGLGMYGAVRATGGLANKANRKGAGVDAALRAIGMDDSPLAKHGLTTEGLTLQALEEDGLVKINRALNETSDERLGFLLSKEVIEAAGRTVPEAATFADRLVTLRRKGIRVSDDAIVEAVDDFLNQGALKHLTTEERLRVEKNLGREEALRMRQESPTWQAAMQTRLSNITEAQARLSQLTGDVRFISGEKGLQRVELLDPADAAAVLEPLGIRPKVALDIRDIRLELDAQRAAIENMTKIPAVTPTTPFVARSSAGRILTELSQHLATIEEQTRLGGKGSGGAVKAAKEEIKRLSASLNSLYKVPPRQPKPVIVRPPSAPVLDRMSPAEQAKVIADIIDRLDSTPNEVVQGTTIMSKSLRAVGYEGPIQKFLLNRTGIYSTARSLHKAMREAAGLFGAPDYNARVFAGRGGAGVGVIAAMGRAEREVAPIKMFLEELANRKGMTEQMFRQFNADVESALNRKARMPKGSQFEKEGNQFIDQWQRYVGDTDARARRTRSLRPSRERKVSTFLPLVVHEPYLRANYRQAVEDLSGAWQRQAEASQVLSPEYMEALGWIERPTDVRGNRVGKVVWKDTAPIDESFKKGEAKGNPERSHLTPEGLKQYEAAVKDVKILEGPAEKYWSRFLNESSSGDVRSANSKVYGPQGRNVHRRQITQRMLEEFPALKPYFNRDLFTMAERYAKTVGFKTHVGESIQRQFGINATLGQVMNSLEAKMKFEAKGNPELAADIASGWDKMHEMVAWTTGSLPHTDPTYSSASRYAFDFIGKTASLPVMGGMALANGWEAMARMFTMVHAPADLGRNMKAVIRGLFADRSVLREELAGMSQDLRRLSVGYAHQLQAGRVDAAYELTTRGVLTRPWKDAWNLAMGRTAHGAYKGRVASTALATLDALNKNAYVMGGGPRIQHATEVMMAGAAQREFMRYGDAIIKLRESMAANPIDPGDTQKAHKSFTDLARRAGFGDRWDLAQRFIRWDLHEPGMVEAIQSAAANVPVKNKLHVKTNDLLEQYSRMPAGKAKDDLYEAIQRHNQYVDDRIKEELGEATAWSARTDRRSPQGRALDLFTNYMHNMYFHKLAKSSSMPSRVFLGIITGLTISELMQKVTYDYLNGMSQDQMLAQWDTPEEALGSTLSTAMRIPMFGAISFIPKYVADSAIDTFNRATGNDSINPFQPKFGGVVGSALDNMFRLGRGANQWAFGLTPDDGDRGRRTFLNAGIRYLPIINSVYGKAAVRTFTDWKVRQTGGGRNLGPTSDGRSIWGDEDIIKPTEQPIESTPPVGESGFDLNAALTERK